MNKNRNKNFLERFLLLPLFLKFLVLASAFVVGIQIYFIFFYSYSFRDSERASYNNFYGTFSSYTFNLWGGSNTVINQESIHDLFHPPASHQLSPESQQQQQHGEGGKKRSICQICGKIKSVDKLWFSSYFQNLLLGASQHPDDPDYSHYNWTQELLHNLYSSKKSNIYTDTKSSHDTDQTSDKVSHIINILQLHLDHYYNLYEQNNNMNTEYRSNLKQKAKNNKKITSAEPPPPLKIAVVGGSMTEGNGCSTYSDKHTPHIPRGSIMTNPMYCAWPYRLEHFVNSLLSGVETDTSNQQKIIQIISLAEEGTETALMTPLLRNWRYPPQLIPEGPDIIINAYSLSDYSKPPSNDEHNSAENDQNDLYKKVNHEMTSFVDAIESSHPCGHTPLILHLHDLLPMEIMLNSQAVSSDKPTAPSFSYWENVISVEYRDMISTFKAKNKKDINEHSLLFGMDGHMALMWTLTYNFMHVLLQHCENNNFEQPPVISTSSTSKMQQCQDASTGEDPCTFAFFAGPAFDKTFFKPGKLSSYIKPYTVENNGWETNVDMSAGFSRKTGLVASFPHAHLIFEFSPLEKEVNFINLMILRSNQPKWMGGVARFSIYVDATAVDKNEEKPRELSFDVPGFHTKSEPITYPIEVDLKGFKAPVGSILRVSVELVQGTSFKIIGMMFCS